VKEFYPQFGLIFQVSGLVGVSFSIYVLHYFISYFNNTTGNILQRTLGFIFYFPLFVSLFIGVSLSNSIGIIQGYLGIKSGFVRTPKFNAISANDKVMKSKYAETKVNWLTVTEGLLIIYFLFGLAEAFYLKNYESIPLLLMAFAGFSMIFGLSIYERMKKNFVAKAA
jgi:hypothetical protein